MPLLPRETFSWEYPSITDKSSTDTSSRLVLVCSEPNGRNGALLRESSPCWAGVRTGLHFSHLAAPSGGNVDIFVLRQSLCGQLQASQKPQGLGLAVTAWEIHRAHGSQVSQLRNEHEAFLLASGQPSPWWAFWVSTAYTCSGALLVCGEG